MTYNELLRKLKGTGKLWEDPDFPAINSSVSVGYSKVTWNEWKRVKDIIPRAELVAHGPSRQDVKKQSLDYEEMSGFLSTLSLIADNELLFKNVVPDGQDFEENYIGAFKFRFWRSGQWLEVIVDDRISLVDGKVEFVYSDSSTVEFWAPLAMKAYAKLNGTYEDIMKISQAEAMQDVTAGICETYNLHGIADDFFDQIQKYWTQSCIMGCFRKFVSGKTSIVCGIETDTSHSISHVIRIKLNDGSTERLLRVRGPNATWEFQYAWSDGSDMWNQVSPEDKQRYLNVDEDGEAWMSYDEFKNIFSTFVVCHLGPESLDDGINDKSRRDIDKHEGSWVKNVTGGGSRDNIDLYATNPQYMLEVRDKDDEEEIVTIIVCMTQINLKKKITVFNGIGYDIYHVEYPEKTQLDREFFIANKPLVENTEYLYQRDIASHHTVPSGCYVIVPSTKENVEGNFILRIGARKLKSRIIDEVTGRTQISYEMKKRIANMSVDKLTAELKGIFKNVSGSKGFINSFELKEMLNAILAKDSQTLKMKTFEGLSLDDCRSMIGLYDLGSFSSI